ncbi:MAG: carboxypeptidase regulatory-like domain-containing protein [Pyrinomonadaceae bacterium]
MRNSIAFLFICILAVFSVTAKPTTGGIKGKVKTEEGQSIAGVTVIASMEDREVAKVHTNAKGDFVISNLAPGFYKLSFQKPGRQNGTLQKVEVTAGTLRTLRDRLILPVDEGSLAFIRGLVFSAEGHSVAGARIELARLENEGKVVKIDERISNELGEFGFRFGPENAKYRLTVKANGAPVATKEMDINGPEIYRIAITLPSNN